MWEGWRVFVHCWIIKYVVIIGDMNYKVIHNIGWGIISGMSSDRRGDMNCLKKQVLMVSKKIFCFFGNNSK